MAKLRFKLSQRHSKSKDKKQLHGKMAAVSRPCSPSSCCQKQRDQGNNAGLPRIPYIRCGFLQGKPPKVLPSSPGLPQSPVNRKAVDIAFPAAGAGAPLPATPLPKKWLTLGCDPCKQQVSLLHEDYKLRPSSVAAAGGTIHDPEHSKERRQKRKHRTKLGTVTPVTTSPVADRDASSSPSPAHSRGEWQPEMRWKVVARSDQNRVVQRQVVLQKKASAPLSSKHRQQQKQQKQQSRQESMLMSDQDAVAETLTSPAPPPASFKSGPEAAMYKLMTTSPDQSMENDSPYAWEKDLSPFASESSIFTSFDSPNAVHRFPASRICASPQTRKPAISSRHIGSNSSSSSSGGGSGGSAVFKLASPGQSRFHWSTSPPLAPGQFDDYHVSHKDLEALSKSWEKSKETSKFCLQDQHQRERDQSQQGHGELRGRENVGEPLQGLQGIHDRDDSQEGSRPVPGPRGAAANVLGSQQRRVPRPHYPGVYGSLAPALLV